MSQSPPDPLPPRVASEVQRILEREAKLAFEAAQQQDGKAMPQPRVNVTLTFQMDATTDVVQRVAALIDELEQLPGVQVTSRVEVGGVEVSLPRHRAG